MSLVSAAVLGLGLGVKHAFEADHVAAVCALVSRRAGVGQAARCGALWGLGHGAVIVIAGGALIASGLAVPASIATALDAVVAVMLVGLGVAALVRRGAPDHGHTHAGPRRRPILVGLVHGASGTAALVLLVASTIPARAEALAFVTLFGAASVLGMAGAAAALAWPLERAARWAPALGRALAGAAGIASIASGLAVGWAAAS